MLPVPHRLKHKLASVQRNFQIRFSRQVFRALKSAGWPPAKLIAHKIEQAARLRDPNAILRLTLQWMGSQRSKQLASADTHPALLSSV